jgi:hypothetical protein
MANSPAGLAVFVALQYGLAYATASLESFF